LDFWNGLYYYRARYYDSEVGRFLSEDPIGFQAGVNFYAYVNNNPLRFNDPSGLDSFLVTRPLDSTVGGIFATHNFIVTNADFVGDSGQNTIVNSFGQTDAGTLGRVTNLTTNEFSGTTNAADIAYWRSLGSNSTSVTQLNATDSRVQGFADNLIENLPYRAVPELFNLFGGNSANSNSAAQAIANQSTGTVVDTPNGIRVSPGSGFSDLIQFNTSNISSAASGGFVLYPNALNLNLTSQVYSK